jgi:hypothetical protein
MSNREVNEIFAPAPESHQENLSISHVINPLLMLKILQLLKTKGSVTSNDVKLLNLQNASLSTDESLK